MKVIYTGVQQGLPEKLQAKLDGKFAKLSKLLDKKGEREAHVIVRSERRLHKAEITVQFYDHSLVGIGSDADLFTAMSDALLKLEKQAVKQQAKWRDKNRKGDSGVKVAPEPVSDSAEQKSSPRIYRPNHFERRKPMTLEEALIQMDGKDGYLAYRDTEKDSVSVLIRRKDGNFDLIEA
jgi:putative sigma-54 modulation protein